MTHIDPSPIARIRYTATVISPDDSDTDVYGDPVESGYGQSMDDGWWNPDWDFWSVFPDRDSGLIDEIFPDDDRFDDGFTLDEIIAETIGDRIGAYRDNGDNSYYGESEYENYETGENVIAAAHVTYMRTIAEIFCAAQDERNWAKFARSR